MNYFKSVFLKISAMLIDGGFARTQTDALGGKIILGFCNTWNIPMLFEIIRIQKQ